MKSYILTLLGILIMGTTSASPVLVKANAATSQIKWEASKITGSAHHGTVALKDGQLSIDNGKVSGGTFTINMQSILNEDLSGDMKASLEKHLKSDDFFAVDKYPVATLILTKITQKDGDNYSVTGQLTIREKTNPVSFDASVKTNSDGSSSITARRFSIDRTQWEIIYGSGSFFKGLADKAINNEVYFEVSINTVK